RLRLDDAPGAVPERDLEDELVDVVGGRGPQDGGAPRACARLEGLEPDVEVVERALADGARRVARRLEVVELDDRRAALVDELALDLRKVALQPRVAELVVRARLE